MKSLTKYKGILLTLVLIAAAMYGYNYFVETGIAIPSELEAASIGEDIIKIRAELQRVTLDESLFTTPGYISLIDFTIDIPPQPTGRPNPFSIIGRD